MNRVLSTTAIIAAGLLVASGASAAPPVAHGAIWVKELSQVDKVHERRYYRYSYDEPYYYRPARRYYYSEPYYYGSPYVSVGVPFFSFNIGPDRRYYHRRYDRRHFYAHW